MTFDKMISRFGEETVFLTKKDCDGVEGKLKEVCNPDTYLHNSEKLFLKYPELNKIMCKVNVIKCKDK